MESESIRIQASPEAKIDEAILDFVIFEALNVLLAKHELHSLAEYNDSRGTNENFYLDSVDAFLTIFKTRHKDGECHLEVKFRLRLLQFAVLFTKRLPQRDLKQWMPSISKLRKSQRENMASFSSNTATESLTQRLEQLKGSTEGMKSGIMATKNLDSTPDQEQTNVPLVSLLDLLPSFMALSAIEIALHSGTQITSMWMRLAAGFMAQAVIEQYLVYKSDRHEVLQEAFAWGFDPDAAFEEDSDSFLINTMFFDDTGEFTEWGDVKQAHIDALCPPADQDFLTHLENLSQGELSRTDFNQRIMAFVEGMSQSITPPLLTQLDEKGRVRKDL